MNVKDLTGQKFGKLTVLQIDGRDRHGNSNWLCQCECGNTVHKTPSGLKKVEVPSCGCYNHGHETARRRHSAAREQNIGKTFGRLEVLSVVSASVDGTVYRCRCVCGNIKDVNSKPLISGNTSSCGCLALETVRTHGMSNHRLYTIWENMVQRCTNERNTNFEHYGARGILICEEWRLSFQCFYNWAIINGYRDDLTIDRRNNDLGYSPDNCHWVSQVHQVRNRRTNILDPDKVASIRSDERSDAEVAKDYKTSRSYIRKVKNHKVWKDI